MYLLPANFAYRGVFTLKASEIYIWLASARTLLSRSAVNRLCSALRAISASAI